MAAVSCSCPGMSEGADRSWVIAHLVRGSSGSVRLCSNHRRIPRCENLCTLLVRNGQGNLPRITPENHQDGCYIFGSAGLTGQARVEPFPLQWSPGHCDFGTRFRSMFVSCVVACRKIPETLPLCSTR
jgi:hypothetical protein